MRPTLRLLPVVAALALLAGSASAQPEIVPAEHAIYDFLHLQRVRGLLPEYRHEWRPMGRDGIAALLDSVHRRTDGGAALDAASRHWFNRFVRELHEPPGSIERVLSPGERIRIPRRAESRKLLFYHRDDDWRIALSAIGRLQARLAEEDGHLGGTAFVPEGILEGNYRGIVGFYSGTFNGVTLSGDTRVLRQDPQLAPLYYVAITPEPQGNFDRSTASLRAASRGFSAEIGHARLIAGTSFADPLILAENSDFFSFLRLGFESRIVQYAFLHGALGDRSQAIAADEGAIVLAGPQRFIAFHRLTLNPWQWLQVAFSEAVVYGNRGVELAYLNPLYPIKPAEHALWDRDNANFALEATVRPAPGVEGYLTWFVADLDLRRIGQGSYNNKWAFQAGLGGAVGPATGWVEYTRIEPFVYTHRFQLDGSFYNSYVHNGFGLGHPLGPNTDQWLAGIRGWLPLGLRGEISARYVRRGENFVDPVTGDVVNVGGDVLDGRQPPFTELSKQFLAGDRFEGPGLRSRLTWEPVQDLGLSLVTDFQSWRGDEPSRLFVRTELFIAL